jgi:hypothetical protein
MHATHVRKKSGQEKDIQVEVLRFVCYNVVAIVLYLMRRFSLLVTTGRQRILTKAKVSYGGLRPLRSAARLE